VADKLDRRAILRGGAFTAAAAFFGTPAQVKAKTLLGSLFHPYENFLIPNLPTGPYLYLYLKDGTIRDAKNKIVVSGIKSGHSECVNDSTKEDKKKIGPIPGNRWFSVANEIISQPPKWVKKNGADVNEGGIDRPVMHLEPIDNTNLYGRFAFLIHQILKVKYGETDTEGCVGTEDEESYKRLVDLHNKGKFSRLFVIRSTENSTLEVRPPKSEKPPELVVAEKQKLQTQVAKQESTKPTILANRETVPTLTEVVPQQQFTLPAPPTGSAQSQTLLVRSRDTLVPAGEEYAMLLDPQPVGRQASESFSQRLIKLGLRHLAQR
jgi:hypothetical protein